MIIATKKHVPEPDLDEVFSLTKQLGDHPQLIELPAIEPLGVIPTELVPLRRVLESIYPYPSDARRIASDAGADPSRISFDGPPLVFWANVLAEALAQGRLASLARVAIEELPENAPGVSDALEAMQPLLADEARRSAGSVDAASPPMSPLTQLRDVLAVLYPTLHAAKMVAYEASLDPYRIAFNGSARTIWDGIVFEAERAGKLRDVLQVALREYPRIQKLRETAQVVEEYLQAPRANRADAYGDRPTTLATTVEDFDLVEHTDACARVFMGQRGLTGFAVLDAPRRLGQCLAERLARELMRPTVTMSIGPLSSQERAVDFIDKILMWERNSVASDRAALWVVDVRDEQCWFFLWRVLYEHFPPDGHGPIVIMTAPADFRVPDGVLTLPRPRLDERDVLEWTSQVVNEVLAAHVPDDGFSRYWTSYIMEACAGYSDKPDLGRLYAHLDGVTDALRAAPSIETIRSYIDRERSQWLTG